MISGIDGNSLSLDDPIVKIDVYHPDDDNDDNTDKNNSIKKWLMGSQAEDRRCNPRLAPVSFSKYMGEI